MYNRCAVEGLALKTMESTIKTICLGLVRYFQKRPSNSHRNLSRTHHFLALLQEHHHHQFQYPNLLQKYIW